MSMISNLTYRLKLYAQELLPTDRKHYNLLKEAIETIDELSEKVARYNMERSDTFYNGKKSFLLKVNNLPFHDLEKYIVVRLVGTGTELWYYGTYDNEKYAHEVAEEIGNGFVVEVG